MQAKKLEKEFVGEFRKLTAAMKADFIRQLKAGRRPQDVTREVFKKHDVPGKLKQMISSKMVRAFNGKD